MAGEVQVIQTITVNKFNEETQEQEKVEQEDELTVLQGGDHFGEISLLKNVPLSSSMRASKDCHLGVLNKLDFLKILSES